MTSHRNRLLKNGVATILARCILLLRHLLLVPLFVKAWGGEIYGQWLVISAVPTILAFSELGIGTAAGTRLALEVGGGRWGSARRTFSAGLLLSTGLALSVSVLALMLTRAFCLSSIVARTIRGDSSSLIASVLICAAALQWPAAVCVGVFTGLGEANKSYNILNVGEIVRVAAMVALLFYGSSPLVIALVEITLSAFIAIWLYFGATNDATELRGLLDPIDLKIAKELLSSGFGFQSAVVANVLMFQGSMLVANTLFGPVGAAAWGTVRTLSRLAGQAAALVTQAALPEMQLLLGQENYVAARRLHRLLFGLNSLIGATCGLLIGIAGGVGYQLWLSGALVVPHWIWTILGLDAFGGVIWTASVTVPTALNRPWRINLAAALGAALALCGMWIAGTILGLGGLAVGAALFNIVMVTWVVATTLRLINDKPREFTKGVYLESRSLVERCIARLRKVSKSLWRDPA